MKFYILILIFQFVLLLELLAQNTQIGENPRKEIYALIDKYSEARDKKDTVLLRSILTKDVDQLVSSGEWRIGVSEAMEGMQRSSSSNEGKRTLTVEKYRLLSPAIGIIDARYQIEGKEGATRNMWSTFILVREEGIWKISGIRNMLPSNQ